MEKFVKTVKPFKMIFTGIIFGAIKQYEATHNVHRNNHNNAEAFPNN